MSLRVTILFHFHPVYQKVSNGYFRYHFVTTRKQSVYENWSRGGLCWPLPCNEHMRGGTK